MRLYRAALFVLHLDTCKARAKFAPRSRAFRKPYVSSLSHFFTVSDINYLFGSDLWTMVNVLSWPSLNSSSGNFDADWWKFISINKVFSLDNSARLMTQCPTQTFDDTSWVSSDELLSKDEVPATIGSQSCSSRFVSICLESNETFQILDDCYEITHVLKNNVKKLFKITFLKG